MLRLSSSLHILLRVKYWHGSTTNTIGFQRMSEAFSWRVERNGYPDYYSLFLKCICHSRRLFRVTLEISRAECNIDVTPGTLTATDTCIGYHVTLFEASQKVILHTRYVSTCVGAGGGKGREQR
jgi:hypothetical protein